MTPKINELDLSQIELFYQNKIEKYIQLNIMKLFHLEILNYNYDKQKYKDIWAKLNLKQNNNRLIYNG